MRWSWFGWGLAILVSCVFLPALVVQWSMGDSLSKNERKEQKRQAEEMIKVYITDEQQIVTLPLESYIAGVIAAEMPIDFHAEALKAQALTARTYIMRRLQQSDFSDMNKYGPKARGAIVSDTIQHQAFSTDEKLKKRWGTAYKVNKKKVQQVTNATAGKVITYEKKPIYAAFFSTSNGFTENSEEYFQTKNTYLRTVSSPWDQQAPHFRREKKMSVKALTQILEKKTGKKVTMPVSGGVATCAQVSRRTTGQRVATVKLGEKTFTGREVREALQLASSDFSCQRIDDQVLFTTKGYGHGVGMSQWGANLMAEKGKKFRHIIYHYYQGVQIETMNNVKLK